MALLRNRNRREQPGGTTYQMREKAFSIGDDYWIEDQDGTRVLKVNGKALRLRDTLAIEDPDGRELFRIQEKKLRVRDTMEIERGDETAASVKKALVGIRDRFSISVTGGEDLNVKGNFVDHEYEFERDGDTIAEVSKRWLRVRDTYGISIAPGQDDALIIAAAVCIDRMSHD